MKVVAQLVKHFWDRGALALPEASYLVEHGFVHERELAGFEARLKAAERADGRIIDPVLAEQYAAEDARFKAIERLEARLIRRRNSSKRKRGRRGQTSTVKELCESVSAESARRGEPLEGLVRLARPLVECDVWAQAAVVLRKVPSKVLYRRIAAAFREQVLRLDDVWQALDPEPFHRLDIRAHGAAGRAYFALLRAESIASLGKYRWMLHEDVMQSVWNLRTVHRRLLSVMNQLYQRERRVLDRALDGASEAVPAWALVLLHNANRLELTAPQYGVSPEYGLLHVPDEDTWEQAWTAALGMDRACVMHLLVTYYNDAAAPSPRVPTSAERALYCPVGWHPPKEDSSRE